MRLRVGQAARDDLEEIGDDIALISPVSAQRLIKTIRERMREIARLPYAFQTLEAGNDTQLRRRVVGRYLIVYRVEPDLVVILRVLHSARDLARILDLPK